jgi:hypothetical protein
MDKDNIIDVADITLVVKKIMSTSASRNQRAIVENNDMLGIMAMENGRITLNLTTVDQYVASQFDVVVPSGASIYGVESSTDGQEIAYNKIASNRYRIVVYSLDNKAFAGEANFLTIKSDVTYSDISIQNPMFITQSGELHYLNTQTTGINDITSNATKQNTYAIDGRKMKGVNLSKGVYVINGKKHVVK